MPGSLRPECAGTCARTSLFSWPFQHCTPAWQGQVGRTWRVIGGRGIARPTFAGLRAQSFPILAAGVKPLAAGPPQIRCTPRPGRNPCFSSGLPTPEPKNRRPQTLGEIFEKSAARQPADGIINLLILSRYFLGNGVAYRVLG